MSINSNKILFISNGITPYGIHFLKRVANEITDYELKTLYSHEFSMGHWTIIIPNNINASIIGRNEYASLKLNIKSVLKECYKSIKLIHEIIKYKPSVLTILGYGSISHFIVIEFCKLFKLPCLLIADSNIKGDINKGIKKTLKTFFIKRIISRCCALLPCGSLGSMYFQKYGATANQIFWMPNEPDYASLEKITQKDIINLATSFKIPPNHRHLIYSGRLVNIKRVDLLIDAFIKISDKLAYWDLIIAGDGPLKIELKNRIPENLQHRIIWTGFIDSPHQLATLYHLSDVLVLPSDFEPWALVINEAMHVGLAIVCSDVVGAAAELVKDGENGHVFKASNVTSLSEALLKTTDENQLNKYKKNSQKIIQNWRLTVDPIKGYKQALDFALTKAKL